MTALTAVPADLDELVCDFVQVKEGGLVMVRVVYFEWREGQLKDG